MHSLRWLWTASWTEPPVQAVQLVSSAARLRGIRAASASEASGRTTHNPPAGRLTARRTASRLVFPGRSRPRCAAGHSGASGHGIRRSDTPREGWRAARRPRATVSPMSVMPVPELPGALCRQHPTRTCGPRTYVPSRRRRRVCRIFPELADCRAWTLTQPAYRMDAGMVAAMTPAGRFAERRKRRQKPWLAKLEPVRPGPVARHPSLTRYPGPKPPPFARRGAGGHGRRRVRGIPQPERLSTRHLRGVAPHGRR